MKFRALFSTFVLAATVGAGAIHAAHHAEESVQPSSPGQDLDAVRTVEALNITLSPEGPFNNAFSSGGDIPPHLEGICSFHMTVMQECYRGRMSTWGRLQYIYDGSSPDGWNNWRYRGSDHDFSLEPGWKWQGWHKDELLEISPWYIKQKVLFWWNHCGWAQDENNKCGRCQVGEWTEPPLPTCEKWRKSEKPRTQDMDCFFPCGPK